jgi:hypothetical protein
MASGPQTSTHSSHPNPNPNHRPGGRLLLLAAGARSVEDALQDRYNHGCWWPWQRRQEQGLELSESGGDGGGDDKEEGKGKGEGWAPRPVNVGGLLVNLFVVERTSQPLPERPPPPSSVEGAQGGGEQQHQHQHQHQQKKQRKEEDIHVEGAEINV